MSGHFMEGPPPPNEAGSPFAMSCSVSGPVQDISINLNVTTATSTAAAVAANMKTEDIVLFSSLHGRERRLQRDITKRDFKSAIKYGQKEIVIRNTVGGILIRRCKVTYLNVIYITDESMTTEITSYAEELPLFKTLVPLVYERKYNEAKRRITLSKAMITSHLVFIVDMSGSMDKSDMNGHRTRSRGVYYNIAEEYIADKLNPVDSGVINGKGVTFTDVITLIEMRDHPTVIFECEPVSWMLYNKIVELADRNDTRNHGIYLSSIVEGLKILLNNSKIQPKCALGLYFFSDGGPSDTRVTEKYLYDFDKRPQFLADLKGKFSKGVKVLSKRAKDNGVEFIFKACGFGKSSDFEIMKSMSNWASALGCISHFSHSSTDSTALAESLCSTSLTLTKMRTMLTRIDVDFTTRGREKTIATKEDHREATSLKGGGYSFFKNVFRFELDYEQASDGYYKMIWKKIPFEHSQATGIAISKSYFGEGAERIVYKMTEINDRSEAVGPPLVAKESLYKHRRQDLKFLKAWHLTFAKTQRKASKLASKFNERLSSLGISRQIPRVTFLSCSTYEYEDTETPEDNFIYLAEKQLDPANYIKWNNNTGRLDGIHRENRRIYEEIGVACTNRCKGGDAHASFDLEAVAEDDEDKEKEEDGAEEDIAEYEKEDFISNNSTSDQIFEMESRILDDDIPQAFSHFTYIFTKRNELVCDLQGELNTKQYPPVFELTDPCIHSILRKYGRTDHGAKGFHIFFNTHKCNSVCALLRISNGSQDAWQDE